MLGAIDRYAPETPRHRLVLAVVLAVSAVLAFGDALHVITFPMYQLGLPDAAWADVAVFVLGAALVVVTYRLVQTSLDATAPGSTDAVPKPTADGAGKYDERNPEQIVKARYARGELTDDQLENMLARLEDFEQDDGEDYTGPRDFAENHRLDDRQTLID